MIAFSLFSDIDECDSPLLHQCDKRQGICKDITPLQGSVGYLCTCEDGYEGNGYTCTGS